MNLKKSKETALIAILFASMLVIELVSQFIFQVFPLPIKPTITLIPVIVSSLVYGPKVGGFLGLGMGMMSLIRNSIIIGPTSYLFSPFAPGGNLASVVVALLPRILIGILPYFLYRLIRKNWGLALSAMLGAFTNTFFVLTGAFLLFPDFMEGNGQILLQSVVSILSIVEMVISAILVPIIVSRLEKIVK